MGEASHRSHHLHDGQGPNPSGQHRIEDFDFDTFENQVLEIARHFFLAFSVPHSHAWIEAFRKAEQMFPVPFGATIANAILIAVNDMRVSRVRMFSYMNPQCEYCRPKITDEERYLLSALRDIRQGRRGAAEANCLLLCEGGETADLLASLERIAIITGDVQEVRFN